MLTLLLPLLLLLLLLLSLPLLLLPVLALLPLLSLLSLPLRLLSAELYLHVLPVVALRDSAASSLSRILAYAFPPAWFFVQTSPAAERRSSSSDSSGPCSGPDRSVLLPLPLPLAFPPLLMLMPLLPQVRCSCCRFNR